MRTWSNARGEGQLFSVDLLDEDGSEIKGTFFKADAEKWINVLTEGQVYSFCGGRVKVRFAGLIAERGWGSLCTSACHGPMVQARPGRAGPI